MVSSKLRVVSRKLLFVVCCFLLAAFCLLPAVRAAGPCTTGGDILTQLPDAKSVSMGSAHLALAEDINILYLNPSGLAMLKHQQLGATYLKGLEDTGCEFLCYALPAKIIQRDSKGVLGIGLTLFQGGQMEVYYPDERRETVTAQSDFVLTLGYAWKINPDFCLGGSLKGLSSRLVEKYSTTALAVDLGGLANYPLFGKQIQLGGALRNLGGKIKYDTEGDPLPYQIAFGAAYKILEGEAHSLLMTVDLNKVLAKSFGISLGVEYLFNQLLALRAGYQTLPDSWGRCSCGLGLKFYSYELNYAFRPSGVFSPTHRASFLTHFYTQQEKEALKKEKLEKFSQQLTEKTVKKYDKSARKYYREGKYSLARMEWNKALLLDPENKKLASKISETTDRLFTVQWQEEINKHINLALGFYQKNQLSEALDEFKEVLRLDPANLRVQDYLNEIGTLLSEVIPQKEAQIRPYFAEAVKYYTKGNYSRAIQLWEQILKILPEHKPTLKYLEKTRFSHEQEIIFHLQRAEHSAESGDYLKAITEWKKVLQLDPNRPEVLPKLQKAEQDRLQSVSEQLAQAKELLEQGKSSQAKTHLIAVLNLDPTNQQVKQQLRKLTRAMATREKAKQSGEILRLSQQAADLFSKEQYTQSAAMLKKILALDPENENAQRYLQKVECILEVLGE